MPDFEPVLLKRINQPDSAALASYRADGGYRAAAKALGEMTPAQVIDASSGRFCPRTIRGRSICASTLMSPSRAPSTTAS
jgi:NADH:ubiquinone oxidoreductase subunit F (NADH-binding)